jgi:transposase-like protein
MKEERISRRFSMPLKLDLVKQIEKGSLTAVQVSKIYSVSTTSVYRWLRKYSAIYKIKDE